MKRFAVLIVCMLCLALCGCSHSGEELQTKVFEIAMDGDDVLGLKIPADWNLSEMDGFHYWKFNDDTTIYRTKTPVVTGDKKGECWYSTYAVSRNFDDYTITISTDKKMVDTVGEFLNKAKVAERSVAQYKERELEHLPEFQDYPMDMSSNGLYMPIEYNEVTSDVFTSCHSINGNSFITCWIMNYKLDDLKPMLNNLVTCNAGGKLSAWYENDSMYYAEAGNLVVAAKKLTYNQWCCYLASNDAYADYAIKALYMVTSAE